MKENNDDLFTLCVLAEGEMDEFTTALLDLITNPSQEAAQEVGQEAADVAIYLASCMRVIGSSLEDEMVDKTAYNTARFTSKDFTEKPYSQAYPESKAWVKDTHWKQQYYQQPRIEYNLPEPQNG